jgi:hypothetical protein
MEIDELDANVIVVDDDLQAEWLKLVPGQQAHLPDYLPEAAPWQGLSIVCCTQENGPTADGDRMVTVWWLKMETTSPGPPAVAADLWSPLRVPGPTSGADPGSIYGFIAWAVWAAEPQLDFFVSFIDLAILDVQLPHTCTSLVSVPGTLYLCCTSCAEPQRH